TIPVFQEFFLVVEKLFSGLGGEFVVRTLDDRIHRAGFLAEAAIDALRHVDIVAGGAPRAVLAGFRLDGDGLRRADRVAQLAGDAALLARGIAAKGVLAAEARAQRSLLVGIVQGGAPPEHVPERQRHALRHLPEEEAARAAIEKRHLQSPVSAPAADRSSG